MKTFLVAAIALLPLHGGSAPQQLKTRYTAGTSYVVTRETSATMETTLFEIERDGVPVERAGFDIGDRASQTTKRVVYVDSVVSAEGGKPTEVERTFETLEGRSLRFGREIDLDTELAGAVLRIEAEANGDVEVELIEGSVENDESLEGQGPTLPFDALLPGESVAPGESWSIGERDALLEALGLDVDDKLFQQPQMGRGGREGGEGRRGRRGRGSHTRLFQEGEWEVDATLLEEKADVDGVSCSVIAIEARTSGTLDSRGGGRGRGPFHAAAGTASTVLGTEFEVDLSGKLYFSSDLGRPIALKVKGEMAVETDTEYTRGESTVRVQMSQEGVFEQSLTVSSKE